jgi:hypothetical protein
MAEPLPYAGKITWPKWSAKLNAQEMQTGSLKLKLPIGLHPVSYTSTIEWNGLTNEQVKEVVNQMAAKSFNGVYEYTDATTGLCFLRPTGDLSYSEAPEGLFASLAMGFDKL